MRIVTRPDFDGVVCAVLLYEALDINGGIYWVEPNQIQNNEADIKPGDIIANLPYNKNASLWFDHHVSNIGEFDFEGAHEAAPSAAGVIYQYYQDLFQDKFDELILETDKIDSADLDIDQVNYPEKYPYLLLSMTIRNRQLEDAEYWEKLVSLLREKKIDEIMCDEDVKKRCKNVIEENRLWKNILTENTSVEKNVSIVDLRRYGTKAPSGNRFLVYSMFPDTDVSIKIRYADDDSEKIILSIGHSIFKKTCSVNIGKLLSGYNGGGHRGAGACSIKKGEFDFKLSEILEILHKKSG
ncbi:MAG: exopolyphosphatase [Deltaproteobacteria bacterium]|nr:MAG: exopolyphosphatase [Deltaproteobacteria bacterium]PIE74996.1 MAG: exopolyphosphatase [Deltaproteobacteria bacterium]